MELIDEIMMHITDYCKDPEAVSNALYVCLQGYSITKKTTELAEYIPETNELLIKKFLVAKKIGCKYCRMEENGDFGPDLEPLLVMESGWKPVTKNVKALMINGYKNAFVATHLMEVTVFDNRLNICFNGEYEFEREIRFCPMCGRELKKNDCT